jgi:hypothetical protein
MWFEAFPDVRTFRTCFPIRSTYGEKHVRLPSQQLTPDKRPERPERPKPPMKMLGKKLGRLEIITSGKCPKRPEVDTELRTWKQRN